MTKTPSRPLFILAALALLTGCKPDAPVALEDQNAVTAFALQHFVDSNEISGAVTLVTGPDRILGFEAFGVADIEARTPMRKDAIFWIASMTKPITSMGVMMLVEQGKVKLDDPVEKYIPAFKGQKVAGPGGLTSPKRPVTVKDLLTHTCGLTSKSVTPANEPSDTASLQEQCDFYGEEPLQFEPGSKWAYSNAGINTLGRIIEIVSGKSYGDYIEESFFTPLGMTETSFWPNKELQARLAVAYKKDKQTRELVAAKNTRFSQPLDNRRRSPMPAGGLFSCAEDLAKLTQMILNDGTIGGRTYLKKATLRQMTTNQLGDLPKVSFAEGMHMGLGFHIVHEPKDVTESLNVGAFGHGGAFGTQAWIDPVAKRAYILLIQRVDLKNSDQSEIRREFQKAAKEAYAR